MQKPLKTAGCDKLDTMYPDYRFMLRRFKLAGKITSICELPMGRSMGHDVSSTIYSQFYHEGQKSATISR